MGVAATVLLHSLLIVAAVWGDSASDPAPREDAVGSGANMGSADGVSEERLILIQLQPDQIADVRPPSDLPVLAELPPPLSMLQIAGPDALPLEPLDSGVEPSLQPSEAELIARVQLQGMYEGQIRARIERAWSRPRDEIEGQKFSCRVLIHQDPKGAIGEIELQQCNGSERWQRSLTDAIFASSPLPAPPHPKVFVDAFSLRFEAITYSTAQPAELYEPMTRRVSSTVSEPQSLAEQAAMTTSANHSNKPNASPMLYLNTVDGRVEWSTTPPPKTGETERLVIPSQ